MSSLAQFNVDMDKAVKKLIHEDVADVLREAALMVFAGVVNGSPVDTGRFRASWTVGIGTKSDFIAEDTYRGTRGPDGEAARNSQQEAMERGERILSEQNVTGEDLIVISNNLPYASELANGSSEQAANGWIDLVIDEVEEFLEEEGGGKRRGPHSRR